MTLTTQPVAVSARSPRWHRSRDRNSLTASSVMSIAGALFSAESSPKKPRRIAAIEADVVVICRAGPEVISLLSGPCATPTPGVSVIHLLQIATENRCRADSVLFIVVLAALRSDGVHELGAAATNHFRQLPKIFSEQRIVAPSDCQKRPPGAPQRSGEVGRATVMSNHPGRFTALNKMYRECRQADRFCCAQIQPAQAIFDERLFASRLVEQQQSRSNQSGQSQLQRGLCRQLSCHCLLRRRFVGDRTRRRAQQTAPARIVFVFPNG